MDQTFSIRERSGERAETPEPFPYQGRRQTSGRPQACESPRYATASHQEMGQYDDVECIVVKCVRHDAAKHGCDHLPLKSSTEFRITVLNPRPSEDSLA
ncbi:hypothetical protein TNCV_346211 [Trichonephila clavipes]|nr:hypothetical protein TNCV_346211 [Trichonephila clavipes]